MIEIDVSVISSLKKNATEVKSEPYKEWKVEASKSGKFYQVTLIDSNWDCTCPSKIFHRGDCKHIKLIKSHGF